MKRLRFVVSLSGLLMLALAMQAQSRRWTEAEANSWYQQQPWLAGSNFIPSNAINELEMWQAATFDPQEIDKELGWADGLGMNTMRVFLHDLLWQPGSNNESTSSLQSPPGITYVRSSYYSTPAGTHFRNSDLNIRPSPACTTPAGCKVRELERSRTRVDIRL